MKVLFINGSPRKNGCTYTALHEIEKILNEEGIETEYVNVPSNVSPCMVNETYAKLDECDGIVVGTPVYYAGPSGSLKCFLDRLFYSYPNKSTLNLKAAASISNSRRGGNITSNDVVTRFFSISGMTVITSTYWNDVHGEEPEDVLKDEEAMQTMRNLGRNMAYYIKARKLAKENGIEDPAIEKGTYTNFIR